MRPACAIPKSTLYMSYAYLANIRFIALFSLYVLIFLFSFCKCGASRLSSLGFVPPPWVAMCLKEEMAWRQCTISPGR